MGFQHKDQQQHKRAGMMKAAQSKRTPAHLRPHLQKAAQGSRVIGGISLANTKGQLAGNMDAKACDPFYGE